MTAEPEPNSSAGATQDAARHILRRRAVAWFEAHAYEPGAIPNAMRAVLGGPVMWSEEAVSVSQFTQEQMDLLLRAFDEIKAIYQAAGGRMQQVMTLIEGIGLMPVGAAKWPYQSEEWAAARAMSAGYGYRFPPNLPESERVEAALTQAYYVVLSWIDYVEGGVLDASAIYENDEDDQI